MFEMLTKSPEILSMKHVSEEGYTAYATLQVAIALVSGDLERLIDNVRELVGEVNFRYESTPESTWVVLTWLRFHTDDEELD